MQGAILVLLCGKLLLNRLENEISIIECIYVYSTNLQMSKTIDDMSIS